VHYLLGISALDGGSPVEAVEHFRAALAQYPDRPDLHARIAKAFTKMGSYDDAEEFYRRALELDPSHVSSWTGLTWTSIRRGRWEDAENAALQAVALEFSAPWPHALLGWSRLSQGKTADAITALRMAIRLAPNWLLPQRLLARAMSKEGGPDLLDAHEAVRRVKALENETARKRRAVIDGVSQIDIGQLCEGYLQHAAAASRKAADFKPIETIVVSGLPRSGTSLMMQMLRSAGVSILTDHERAADSDNPEGYFEWERVKSLPEDAEVIREADGMAVKVVSPLLRHLPPGHRIRVIFLHRPIDEVLASQKQMLANQGRPEEPDDARLRRTMLEHQKSTMSALLQTPNAETLIVSYPELVSNPLEWSEKIADFLKPMIELDPKRMAAAVRPELHRNRS
jgi:tetratricopeptide (TPR) repeat protein